MFLAETAQPDFLLFLAEAGWPIIIFVIGAITMHKSGMLPQQRRLDTLLKDVIKGLEDQLRLRDETIRGLQQQIDAANSALATYTERARSELEQKEAALAALHTALMREQQQTTEMRAQIADNQLKVGALVERQRKGGTSGK